MLPLCNFHQNVDRVTGKVMMLGASSWLSITPFFSKTVNLIKPISSHIFSSVTTKLATMHLQAVFYL